MKPIRLATNRDYEDNSIEWIEIDHLGFFYWKGEDDLTLKHLGLGMSFSFLVDLPFVEEFFAKLGRTLDKSKLPTNYVVNPYARFC